MMSSLLHCISAVKENPMLLHGIASLSTRCSSVKAPLPKSKVMQGGVQLPIVWSIQLWDTWPFAMFVSYFPSIVVSCLMFI